MRLPLPMVSASEGRTVELGSRVRLRDMDGEEEYLLVSRALADPAHGRISDESPVGRAVLGRGRGEEVEVTTPGGVRRLTIVDVAPGSVLRDGTGSDACAP
jgi:transcription elongation GreA/GreB family factor